MPEREIVRQLVERSHALRFQLRGLTAAILAAVAIWLVAWWKTPARIPIVSVALGAVVVVALVLVRALAAELADTFRAIRGHTDR